MLTPSLYFGGVGWIVSRISTVVTQYPFKYKMPPNFLTLNLKITKTKQTPSHQQKKDTTFMKH